MDTSKEKLTMRECYEDLGVAIKYSSHSLNSHSWEEYQLPWRVGQISPTFFGFIIATKNLILNESVGITGFYSIQIILLCLYSSLIDWKYCWISRLPLLFFTHGGGASLPHKDLRSEKLLAVLVPQLACLLVSIFAWFQKACSGSIWTYFFFLSP